MDSVLDVPVGWFTDEETGEEIPLVLGDAIADSSDSVASVVGGALSANPLLSLLGAAGAGGLLSAARRRKQTDSAQNKKPAKK
jgi:hypothetical protein